MTGVTYDAGALIGAERDDRVVWLQHRRALERRVRPTVPAAVLAQAWRGGPQPQLSRLLRSCRVDELTEDAAREAGAALARSGTGDVVDAIVVTGAKARHDAVVTADPDDLKRIAAAIGVRLRLVVI